MTLSAAPRGFSEQGVTQLSARRDEPEWVRERRLAAWKTYEQIPMPTRQDEEWRRTDLRDLRLNDFAPYSEPSGDAGEAGALVPEAEREEAFAGFLGLRDGQVVERRLDPALEAQGVIFTDLATAAREHTELVRENFMTRCVPASDGKFAALHGAFWDNGVFLYVPAGVTVESPLRAVISAALAGSSSFPHTLIVMDANSQAKYVEDVRSDDTQQPGFSSRVTELILGPESNLHYVGDQRWGDSVWDFHTERALLDRESELTLQTVELGSRLSKGRVETVLRGDGASAKLLGVYAEDGQRHFDRYTLQDHIGTNGVSDLLFKGVLTDKSRSVYSGLIRVEPGAKRTAAYQQNRNLLLSRTARADSIPNLEIKENDILGCSHGATIGKVDEEQVFYLMCRGLSRDDATQLIVQGFVDPLIAEVPVEGLRESLRQIIGERISREPIVVSA